MQLADKLIVGNDISPVQLANALAIVVTLDASLMATLVMDPRFANEAARLVMVPLAVTLIEENVLV